MPLQHVGAFLFSNIMVRYGSNATITFYFRQANKKLHYEPFYKIYLLIGIASDC